jgi:ferredoxin
MQGWTEKEIRTKDLMAPCGLYCGTCAVYIATGDRNEKSKAIMANLYGTKPEQTECLGCM